MRPDSADLRLRVINAHVTQHANQKKKKEGKKKKKEEGKKTKKEARAAAAKPKREVLKVSADHLCRFLY